MKKVYIFLALVLITYVVARTLNVAFTHDEAATYVYLKYPIPNILINHPITANNHILNTLLAKFFAIFSVHEFSLRLPNVLSFFLYIYTAYKLSVHIARDRFLQLCFFLAMFANVALLELFALCRGYGIGISLIMFSVYQLILLYKEDSKRNARVHLCLSSSILAVFANFALVNPAFLIFLLLTVRLYQVNSKKLLSTLGLPVLYGIGLLALCAYPFWRLMTAGELYYGGEYNFIKDTIYTMLDDMTRGWARQPEYYTKFLVFFTTIITLSIVVPLFYIRKARTKERLLLVGPAVLAGCILLINAQFYLLGTKLVIYRTALYLFPLIVVSAFSAAEFTKLPIIWKRSGTALVTALFLFALFCKADTTTTREWWFDVHNKDVLAYILEYRKPTNRKTRLFSHWLMSKSLDYYVETRYSRYLEPVPYIQQEFSEIDIDSYDFVYARPQDGMGAYPNFQLVASYNEGNFLLYQKKQEIAPATK